MLGLVTLTILEGLLGLVTLTILEGTLGLVTLTAILMGMLGLLREFVQQLYLMKVIYNDLKVHYT